MPRTRRGAEAGCNHRDLHLPFERRVDDRAEDDVGVFVRRFLNDGRCLTHFDQREIRSASDVDDDTAGALDRRVFEQRARNGAARRLDRAVLALGDAGAHHGEPHAGHDRLHVGEVEVDEPGDEDQIGDPLYGLPQHIVGRRECVGQRRGAIDDRQEAFVRNRDDRIDAVAQRFESVLGLQQALLALELERLGHDRNRQRTELAGETGDDRRRTGSGPAAEPGRHEDHVGAVERLNDLLGVFERRLAADGRIRAGAEPFRQLAPDLELERRGVHLERLEVRVRDDEFDTVQPRSHHPVDGIAAAAPDADHLDPGARVGVLIDLQPQQAGPSNCIRVLRDVISHSTPLHQKNSLNKPRSRPATRTKAPAPTGARARSPALFR